MAKAKRMTEADRVELVKKYLGIRDRASSQYRKSDEILEQIIAGTKVGQATDMGDGRIVTLIDNFARKNKVFKPAGCARLELEIRNK